MDRVLGLVEKGRAVASGKRASAHLEQDGKKVVKPKRTQAALYVTDFEEQYARLDVSKCRTPADLLLIPDDEVTVEVVPRKLRTARSSVPSEVASQLQSLPPHVRDCLFAFEKNWLLLRWKYRHSARPTLRDAAVAGNTSAASSSSSVSSVSAPLAVRELPLDSLPELRFEAQEFDWPEEVNNDIKMDESIIALPQKDATLEDIIRLEPRHDLFTMYRVPPSSSPNPYAPSSSKSSIPSSAPFADQLQPTDLRPVGAHLEHPRHTQLLVHMKELRLRIGEVDPFFLTAAVYDLDRDHRRRVSEFFHFELNISSTLSLVKGRPGPPSPLTSATQALFNLTHQSPTLYLVIRIETVLHGPYEQAADPYFKVSMKQKEKNKLISISEDCAHRMGRFTQPFGLAVVPLFAHGTALTAAPQEFFVTELLRVRDLSDMYLFSKASQLTVPASHLKKNFKVFPGHLTMDMRLMTTDEAVPNRFTPSLVPVLPQKDGAPIIREIQEFGLAKEESYPYLDYVNHLYVYPTFVNLGGYKGPASSRNITCVVYLLDSDEHAFSPTSLTLQSLNAMYGRGGMSTMVDHEVTSVTYHQHKPHFFEEIKILLPNRMTPHHHLLFVFKHITCRPVKGKKKNEPAPADVLGFAFLPLFVNGRFVKNGEHEISVAYELPAHYLREDLHDEMRWLDRRRPVFTVRSSLHSSVFSEVEQLDNFFHAYDDKESPDGVLIGAIHDLSQMDQATTANYMAVLFNQMLELVCTGSDAVAGAAFQQLITSIHTIQSLEQNLASHSASCSSSSSSGSGSGSGSVASMAPDAASTSRGGADSAGSVTNGDSASAAASSSAAGGARRAHKGTTAASVDRHPYLVSYVNFFYENFADADKKPFAEIVKTWSLLLFQRKDAAVVEHSLRYSWFFFDLIVKSIAQLLADTGQLPTNAASSSSSSTSGASVKRGTRVTPDFIQALAGLVSLLIRELHQLLPSNPVGHILNNTIALFVKDLFGIIDRGAVLGFIKLYCEEIDSGVVGSYFSGAKVEFLRIVMDYEHYVQLNIPIEPNFGTSIQKLLECFDSLQFFSSLIIREIGSIMKATIGEKHSPVRSSALALLRNAMLRHELDPRYQDPVKQQKIALLYFPYILMLMQFESNGSLITLADQTWIPSDMEDLLLCYLWVVKTVRRRFLRKWWKAETSGRVFFFFVVLAKALEVFGFRTAGEHKPKESVLLSPRQSTSTTISKMVDPIKDAALKQGSKNSFGTLARRRLKLKQLHKDSLNELGAPAGASPRMMGIIDHESPHPKTPRSEGKQNANTKRRAYLSLEVNSIVLELLLHFMSDFKSELGVEGNKHMDRVVCNFLLLLLKQNQSELFLSHLFQTVRFLVYNFPRPLFLYNTPYAGDLTYELLRACNFASERTRAQATGLLYIFFKTNWLIKKNLARMKLQCSIAIAKLVGEGGIADVARLQSALLAVVKQASLEKNPPEFVRQLDQLLSVRLITVLENTKLIEQFEYDNELVAELIYEISLGYRDSPDIRYTWLDSLAKRHGVEKNHEEAAQCRVHTTALIVAHLQLLKREDAVEVSRASLREAAPNCAEEFDTSSTSASEEGVCSSSAFSRQGLFRELQAAVASLKLEQIFETAIILQRIGSLIHKKKRDYAELVNVYNDLTGLCHNIVQSDELQGRLFANYYRVAFYGKDFGRADGQEFIYKEHGFVRLSDISSRLRDRYSAKFGADRVLTLPGTGVVDKSKLDPAKLYIQVCSVEPHLTDEQLKERKTPFQKNTNLKRFIFATPFQTSTDKELSETERTGKIKTVLRVEHPFPFVLKRIKVVSKKEIMLTPIQTSLEAIRGRTRALLQEIETKQPNSKTLQIVLQGSVLLQVNAGPLEFCRVFLGPDHVHKYQPAEVKALKHAMGEFVKTCVKALAVNKSIIDADQIAFHDQLVKGYVSMKTEVLKYIGVGQASQSASDLLKKAGSSNKIELASMRQIAQTSTDIRSARSGSNADVNLLSTSAATAAEK
eukprot:CAMPEP_0174230200 /NCGR_PEP_ID=MMETSP0417-20130205/1005_1 /TAXON_ID=242541 /ORGANISM="Mayorella sp, Strain BSH-02190019" /LENGTH=1996 /DNA_ID=CAMNT_0015307841 /DNA_START=193 /DNA_END=6183 /DNA_ORIENTATION=-